MVAITVYLVIWGAVIVVANKHYQHHMAKYGIDTKGRHLPNTTQFHKRFDD